MWLWPYIILLCVQFSQAAPTSLGPTSASEAEVLWQEGQIAVTQARYLDAVHYFQRLVDRYPGKPGYWKAHYFLGKSFLELKQPKKSLPFLKAYLSASGVSKDSIRARNTLGNTYLALGLFHEAYLTTLEVDELSKKEILPSDTVVESLLVKTQALLGLGHEIRAISAIDAAEKQLSEKNSSEVKSQVYFLRLKLKIHHCNQFPGPGPLNEGQLRDQLERRGTCLVEAVLILKKVLTAENSKTASQASDEIAESFKNYYQSCTSPIAAFKGITSVEKQRFKTELSDQLTQDFKKKSHLALEFLTSWKSQLSSEMNSTVSQIEKKLQNL